jgi:hypothetical protein
MNVSPEWGASVSMSTLSVDEDGYRAEAKSMISSTARPSILSLKPKQVEA